MAATGPGTESHVAADRRSADRALVGAHRDSAEGREGSMTKPWSWSTKAAGALQLTTRHFNCATTTSTRSPIPATLSSSPSSSKPPPPTTTSKNPTPSAPVLVHPSPTSPSSSSLTTLKTTPLKPPKTPKMHHTSSTDPPPPDPALFTFPSLLSTLGPEASTPLNAIAEICGRSRMSLADEHGAHVPVLGDGVVGPQEQQQKKQKQKQGNGEVGEEGEEDIVARGQKLGDGRGRGGGAGQEGEGGARGKGWMEGVRAWLWGGGEAGTGRERERERKRGVREGRRVVEEEEGEEQREGQD